MTNRLGIAGGLLQFFWRRKWWWLTPMILMLMFIGGLVVFTQSSAIAPFVRYFSRVLKKARREPPAGKPAWLYSL